MLFCCHVLDSHTLVMSGSNPASSLAKGLTTLCTPITILLVISMTLKRVFVVDPDRCYFYKGAWIQRGHTEVRDDATIEERVSDLEIHFYELNNLLISIWGYFQPPKSPEEQVLVDQLMKFCRDTHEKLRGMPPLENG